MHLLLRGLPARGKTLTARHAELRAPRGERDEYLWETVSHPAALHDHIQSVRVPGRRFTRRDVHAAHAVIYPDMGVALNEAT